MRGILAGLTSMVLLAAVAGAFGQDAAAFDAKHNAVLSKLQSMGHGYYSEKEWAEIDQSVQELVSDAAARNDGDAIVKAAVIRAMVLSDMRRRHGEALEALAAARQKVAGMEGVDASKLFVKEAEVQAEAGNPAAVADVIAAYKASRYYDPKPYAWSGLTGPGDPLVMARPNATEGDSLPLTIMEKALVRAKSAPGVSFPEATLTDIRGRTFALSSLRGRVVLVDFFARGWKIWEESLPATTELWRRYSDAGLEIVSICLEPNATGLDALGLPWSVVAGAPDLTRALGIFGETTNYLLDSNGMVIARDLRGQDLVFAVRRALGR
ncbi:MAG: TlpA family protein disulfide reductase [Kiritimatiellae bacterium]|nr:TlpA family protein disulfide reductase [Kiritimatiellia bacterium]NLD90491.1 TlpA family protein disulfide reductase [Lentisphaerota bacterium]HQQ60664.1 TlpA disulfide reductase family protein [Kiritimatiellia bacterium]